MIENGDFAFVEGSATMVKVHVHVFDPSAPLAFAVRQGFITDVVVENMDAMAAAGQTPDDVKDELSTAPGRDPAAGGASWPHRRGGRGARAGLGRCVREPGASAA